jgi:hypothetical protein
MEKELILPHGVKIVDGVLYFGDYQVMYDNRPYKVYDVNNICTSFAIRYTSKDHTYPRLCTTLDIILPPPDVKDWRYEKGFVWLCVVNIIGGKYIPSAHYDSWNRVEYILKNLVPDLIGSEWFIYVDDENYVWDNETNTVRRQRTIETVSYEWDD